MVLVTTSNRPIHSLFGEAKHGGSFFRHAHVAPLQQLLRRHCNLLHIKSQIDYRQPVSPEQLKKERDDLFDDTIVDDDLELFPESKVPLWLRDNEQDNDIDSSASSQNPTIKKGGNISKSVVKLIFSGNRSSTFFVHGRDENIKEQINDIVILVFQLQENVAVQPVELDVGWGRKINVRSYCSTTSSSLSMPSVARFSFDELCGGFGSGYADLGASDYRAIAKRFDIVVLENVPVLSDSSENRTAGHNQARRFITLIDELYEAQTARCVQPMHHRPSSLLPLPQPNLLNMSRMMKIMAMRMGLKT